MSNGRLAGSELPESLPRREARKKVLREERCGRGVVHPESLCEVLASPSSVPAPPPKSIAIAACSTRE
jgi:hypothetical protein